MANAHVVAVHPHSDLYGSDRMFLSSLAALSAVPNVRLLAVLPKEGPLADEIRARQIPIVILPFPVLRKVEMTRSALALSPLRFAFSAARIARWLRSQGTDALLVSTVACPEWVLAGRLARCRVVSHVHESEPDMRKWVRRILLSQLSMADVVVANSKATQSWIAQPSGDIRVVYNGVEMPSGLPGEASAADHNDGTPTRLLVIGRLSHRKGQDVAIDAVTLLRTRGYLVELTLVGDSYPGYEGYVADLEQQVARAGLEDVVTFAGFNPDASRYLAHADILLVPSRVEPFGNVAVEGLLSSTPTIVSRVGGLTEIVEDGVSGIAVNPGDASDLADAVVRLIDGSGQAKSMVANGLDRAQKMFSPERYAVNIRAAVFDLNTSSPESSRAAS